MLRRVRNRQCYYYYYCRHIFCGPAAPVSAALVRLVTRSSRYDHITPLLRQLHWLLRAPERIQFTLAVLVYRCQHGRISPMSSSTRLISRPRDLHSSFSVSLNVRRTRQSTVSDQAFPVAAVRTWNSLSQHVTSAPSMSVFQGRLKAFL